MSQLATILTGDALEMLRTLETESVHTCVTSPPYSDSDAVEFFRSFVHRFHFNTGCFRSLRCANMATTTRHALLRTSLLDGAQGKAVYRLFVFDAKVREKTPQCRRRFSVGQPPFKQRASTFCARVFHCNVAAESRREEFYRLRSDLANMDALAVCRDGRITGHTHGVSVLFDSDSSVRIEYAC